MGDFLDTVVVSAITGQGLSDLVRKLIEHLPQVPSTILMIWSRINLKFLLGSISGKGPRADPEEVPMPSPSKWRRYLPGKIGS